MRNKGSTREHIIMVFPSNLKCTQDMMWSAADNRKSTAARERLDAPRHVASLVTSQLLTITVVNPANAAFFSLDGSACPRRLRICKKQEKPGTSLRSTALSGEELYL